MGEGSLWILKTTEDGKPVWFWSFKNVFYDGYAIPMSDTGYAISVGEFSYLSPNYGPTTQVAPREGPLGQNILIIKTDQNGVTGFLCGNQEILSIRDTSCTFDQPFFTITDTSIQPIPAMVHLQRYDETTYEEHLFCDEFQDNVLSGEWSYRRPSWSEADGNLIGAATAGSAKAILRGRRFSRIYGVRAELRSSGGRNNSLSLLVCWQDRNNYVELVMNEARDIWTLRCWANGRIVAEESQPYAVIYPDVTYEISVSLVSSNISASCDGSRIFLHIPDDFPLSGTVGFRVKRTTGFIDSIDILGKIE